jgi:DNA invertase Pin-like site-specific DNA recombinase
LILGYVGNKEVQDIEVQIEFLEKNGCWEIYNEHDNDFDKKLLKELVEFARIRDVIIVYSIGCLGMSLKNSINFICELNTKNVNFISIKDGIDTTKKEGTHIFNVFVALGKREREIKELKVRKGLQSIKTRGVSGGRPKKESTLIEKAITLYLKKEFTINEIVKSTGVSKSTLYRELKKKESPI